MSRGRVLFLTARPPYPLDTGAKIRTWNILSGYVNRFDVDVLHFNGMEIDRFWREAALNIGVRSVCGIDNPGMNRPVTLSQFAIAAFMGRPVTSGKYIKKNFFERCVEIAADGYDIVHVDTIHLAGDLAALKQGTRPPKLILNAHNVEWQIAERMRDLETSLPHRLALGLQVRNMRHFEARAFREADTVLAVSSEDLEQIDALAGPGKAMLVENGVDIDYYSPANEPVGRMDKLVFVGSMDWLPNIDGMKWFVRDILPAIREIRPEASITIVGRSPHPDIQALHDPTAGISVTGTVEDVRPFVHEASVVVVPLRFGGGTRLKILEAFAMGKTVLSTALGCEGILCENGRHLYVEDRAMAFASRCLELMGDETARRRLGTDGRELALSRYTWDAVVGRMLRGISDKFDFNFLEKEN